MHTKDHDVREGRGYMVLVTIQSLFNVLFHGKRCVNQKFSSSNCHVGWGPIFCGSIDSVSVPNVYSNGSIDSVSVPNVYTSGSIDSVSVPNVYSSVSIDSVSVPYDIQACLSTV